MKNIFYYSWLWCLVIFSSFILVVRGYEWENIETDAIIIEPDSNEDDNVFGASSLTQYRYKRQFGGISFPWNQIGAFTRFQQFGNFQQQKATPQARQSPTLPSNLGSCVTTRGFQGVCLSFRKCFPVVYSDKNSGNHTLDLRNPHLANELRDASGPCNQKFSESKVSYVLFRRDAELRQNHICCSKPTKTTITKSSNTKASTSGNPVTTSCGEVVKEGSGEFPWLVSLMTNNKKFCGGSLIDSSYILTASHCVAHMTSFDVNNMRVHIGNFNLYKHEDDQVWLKHVSKVIKHRGFSHQTLHNDIALLKLSTPVTIGNNSIRPICLDLNHFYSGGDNEEATVAGLNEEGPQKSIYRKTNLVIWSNKDCSQKYGNLAPGGTIQSNMVCAKSTNKYDCIVDSGSPLMHLEKNQWKQIGIVSFGIGCGKYPGVYTRLSSFSKWITKNRRY